MKSLTLLIVSIALLLAVVTVSAKAQAPSPAPASIFSGVASLSVTTTSANVALPTGSASANVVTLLNGGASEAFALLGPTSSVVVTATNGIPIPAGYALSLAIGNNTYAAAITASGTSTLRIIRETVASFTEGKFCLMTRD